MIDTPKISVLIPVYNVEKYLRECLDSVISQTLREIEIICVDDGSTDCSPDILAEYAQADGRIRVIRHPENRGRHLTRKTGVEAAQGEYLLFLDGDDSYADRDALLRFYQEIKARDVDILQFGTCITAEYGQMKDRVPGLEAYHKPYAVRVETDAKDMLQKAFVEHRWSMNLWDKIYRTQLVQRAYAALPARRIVNAEDLYAYFAITHFSCSFEGAEGLAFHRYRYGRGLYGRPGMSMEFFERLCRRREIIDGLRVFSREQHTGNAYEEILKHIDREFLAHTVSVWRNRLPAPMKRDGFDLLCETWPAERVIAEIAGHCWNKKRETAKAVCGAQCLKFRRDKIRTIAVYYHWMTIGGVQRVISLLLPKWLQAGYRVILITDTEPDERDYPLPHGVKRVVIPDFRETTAENYGVRAEALLSVLKEYDVDLVDYHAWTNELLLWDTLVIRSCGAAINFHTHSVFTQGLENGNAAMADRYAAASLMNSIAVLSEVDAEFYRPVNANVHYISNPLEEQEIRRLPTAALDDRTILWCGRISREKRPCEALEVFALVSAQVPDAKLIMLGDGQEKLKEEMRSLIAEKHLEHKVICPGAVDDVEPYYLQASLLMLTSEFEGHSMVMQESLSYGVPVVTYRMDYLEMVRRCPGIISVDQLDRRAMAQEIIRLLENKAERKALGVQLRREILEFAIDSRVYEKWETLFASIEQGTDEAAGDDSRRILMDTMMDYITIGIRKKDEKLAAAEKKLAREKEKRKDAHAQKQRILASRSYRLARLLGAPVRLLRRLARRVCAGLSPKKK